MRSLNITLALVAVIGATAASAACVDPDLSKVAQGVKLTLCDGTVGVGTKVAAPACTADGATGCLATSTFPAVDISTLAAKVLSGVTVAGTAGSASATTCSSDGQTNCVSSAAFAVVSTVGLASKVLSGQTVAGVAGNVTLPAVNKVVSGYTFGVASGSTGTFALPAAAAVRSGTGAYGDPGATQTPALATCTGNDSSCYLPAYVNTTQPLKAIDYDSITPAVIKNATVVAGKTGDYPSATNPLPGASATTDMPSFASAAGGTAYEWWTSAGTRKAGSTQSDQTVTATTSAQTVNTGVYRSVTVAGDSDLTAGNVQRGIDLFGVTGAFPSSTYPVPRYQDSGATTNVAAAGGISTSLTSFVSQLTTDGSFEYWDSTGIRRTGSGDSDIRTGNIKSAINFGNFSMTGTAGGAAPAAWDLRAGVTVGGVTGKLKMNCRNGVRSGGYNYDGPTASIPSYDASGTTNDWWDTADSGQGTPTLFVAAWSTALYSCGGLGTTTDDNVWTDVTTGGCQATKCRYKDKITNLEWTKAIASGRTWQQAINDCATLTHDSIGPSVWRVPTQKEVHEAVSHGLRSVANANWIPSSIMDAGGTQTNFLWTSTTSSSYATNVWKVRLDDGEGGTYDRDTTTGVVACVR